VAETLRTPVIDSQVHAYERNHPGRPWTGFLHGPEEVTGDDLVAAMDASGVDGSLLVSPWSMYRFDPSYALEVHARHPGRFGLIRPFDPGAPDVEEEVAAWAATKGTVGARLMQIGSLTLDAEDPGIGRMLEACADEELPVNILCWGRVPVVGELARKHPRTQLVVDHLGIRQPFEPPVPDEPFVDLPQVLALAHFDNVTVKISGACTLSREPFPFPDLWPHLEKIFEAFGLERCMWGTDWTRAVGLVTYEQGVEAFRINDRLSASDLATLMGGALSRIYRWTPTVEQNT